MRNCVYGFLKNWAMGYVLRFGISVLVSILKRRKLNVFPTLISRPTLSFALFCGGLWFLSKFILWVLRRIRKKDDKLNSIIAGAFSSLAVLLESDLGTRKLVIFYTFARALESFILTLDSNKILKEPKNWGLGMYMVMICFFVFHVSANPDVVGQGVVKLVDRVGWQKPNDRIIVENIFHQINKQS